MSDNLFDKTYSRRVFLQQGVTFASMLATTPLFLERSAGAMMQPIGSQISSQPGVPEDRVLVVVQLGGGNDGLNTVVPYGDAMYYNRRPGLAVPEPGRGDNAALPFDQQAGIGLHPNFKGFKSLIDEGVASVVQGVGYPNPNRSHFTSMDIWHTADPAGKGRGWLGKFYDNTCQGAPNLDCHPPIAIGNEAPRALVGKTQKPISFESSDLFRWVGEDLHESLGKPYETITRAGRLEGVDQNSQQAFLMRTALDAQVSSDRIRKAVDARPLVSYPRGALARQLQTVGAMIRDDMPTRVYYVSLSGFDTHANQPGRHNNLLRQLGDSLRAFYDDLKAQGNSGRVLTMVFSEFGRRVAQNASAGTDHGTAAPMYFVGDMVRPGLLGTHPSLTDLDQGDLKYNVDFRSIYTGVLKDWMGADAEKVLRGQFRKAKLFRT